MRITIDGDRPRVLVVGGGVAALEACLLLRAHVSGREVDIDLLSPQHRFSYRPLSVLEPFGGAPAWSLPLGRFAADEDVLLLRDALDRVDAPEKAIVTSSGDRLPYDALLVAVGAAAVAQLPGAITFAGSSDGAGVRQAVAEAAGRLRPRIAFALGPDPSWPLPLYELALLTAAELRSRGVHPEITLVTPEREPLELFGRQASALVGGLLDEHGIELITGTAPLHVQYGELLLADGRSIGADSVVALPRATGRFINGVPHDTAGFISVDRYGRVPGVEGVYAAGDVTDYPIKQGGLAAQQADAAAETILADLGVPIAPRRFAPVLRGVLFTGGAPAFLRNALDDHGGRSSASRSHAFWWPPGKIAGRYLSPYLTMRAGAPRGPQLPPGSRMVTVDMDIDDALAGGGG
jgi:sulfide:quinone oxidoreductase